MPFLSTPRRRQNEVGSRSFSQNRGTKRGANLRSLPPSQFGGFAYYAAHVVVAVAADDVDGDVDGS